jgi:hypothetical protein
MFIPMLEIIMRKEKKETSPSISNNKSANQTAKGVCVKWVNTIIIGIF